MAYLGLDIGTTTCKATVIDKEGNVLSRAQAEYDLIIPKPGYVELSGDVIWQNVKTVLKRAAAGSAEPIEAIAIASFGEAFVPLDSDGNIIHNSIYFSDIRGTEEAADILAKIDESELYRTAGVPINTIYTLNKLLWLKKNKPEVYNKTDKFLLYCDFICYKLSGERKLDYSLASRTMFLDYSAKQWSSKILNLFGIDVEKFSKPVPSGSVVGQVLPNIAQELGLNSNTMLVAGGHDQVCAALGAGVLNKGESVDGIGTVECLTVLLRGLDNLDTMRGYNFNVEPYVLEGEYVTLAFNNTAGAVLKWYRNTIDRERSLAAKQAGTDIHAIMESECPPGPTGLLLMPHFAGSGTPYLDSNSSGALLGLKLSTTKGELYKACMEGINFEMLFNAELLKRCGTDIKSITCAGGGSNSAMLLQIKADIMGLPVRKLKVLESGTIGLAMLCAVACGDYASLKDAAKQFVRIDMEFSPHSKNHEIYMEKFQAYKRIYNAVKQIGI